MSPQGVCPAPRGGRDWRRKRECLFEESADFAFDVLAELANDAGVRVPLWNYHLNYNQSI